MKTKYFILFFAAVVVALFASCSSDEPTPAPVPEPAFTDLNLSEAEGRANEGLAGFNNNFFKEAMAEYPEGNVSVSPLSASMLLSVTGNIVDDELRTQILGTLGCNDLAALNTLNRRYMDVLPTIDEKVTMSIANACWYHNAYSISPSFSGILEDVYSGSFGSGNFKTDGESVARDINAWVDNKTRGMIPNIFDNPEIFKNLCSVLVNAVYMKGAWAGPFDRDKTEAAQFQGAESTTTVDMMYRKNRTYYQGGSNFVAVQIPLGSGKFNFTLVLPDEGVTVEELVESDVHSKLNFGSVDIVEFYMPRVDFRSERMPLNDIFERMGIDKLNEIREISMFTEYVETRHTISQKTAVTFNEEGAEASAVTWNVEETYPGFGTTPEIPVLRADRPFLFFIDEATTGAALLWGCIRDL